MKAFILVLLFLSASVQISQADFTRIEDQQFIASGNIYSIGQFGPYPLSGIAITLNNQIMGRSSPYFTDRNGYFFFQNVPQGHYNLEIWLNPNVPLVRQVLIQYNNYGQAGLGSWQI